MSSEPFRVALIGAGGFGANMLRALCRCPRAQLSGLADLDGSLAASAAAEAGCAAYSDNRRLLVETRPDAVFLAVPPGPGDELVRLAGQLRIHVWKEMPLARKLADAVWLCRTTESAGLTFAVGTQRRFLAPYRRAKSLLPELGIVYFVQAQYLFNWGPILAWRGDRAAGGGALLSLGYHMFDLVIWMLGLPETVYCVAGSGHGRPPDARAESTAHRQAEQPVYDTEDTAAVLFRYRDKAMAPVTVSRCFSPVSEALTVFGQAGSITAGPDGCVLRDHDGATLDTYPQQEPPAAVFVRQAEAFVRAAADQAPRYECSGWENLLTMAAVEAAYLSDQTGQPESPAELLARYDVEPGDCLKFAPIEENRK